jgi:hypothetical protein
VYIDQPPPPQHTKKRIVPVREREDDIASMLEKASNTSKQAERTKGENKAKAKSKAKSKAKGERKAFERRKAPGPGRATRYSSEQPGCSLAPQPAARSPQVQAGDEKLRTPHACSAVPHPQSAAL